MITFRMFVAVVAGVLLLMSVDAKYQEMTHVMDMDTMVFHPVYADEIYQYKNYIMQAGPLGNLDYVAWNRYATAEHMGTHYDAPYHFLRTGRQNHQIPLDDLHGPLVRIDIKEKVKSNSKATVDLVDIQNWESRNGRIPDRAYILMDSGWRQYWGDQTAFVGTDTMDEADKFAWPGFNIEAVNWLMENRNFLALGVDTMSCDIPPDNEVHKRILPADKFCVENLNNLDKVPESGAEFFMMPILQKGGTGGQIRAYAFWDDHNMHPLENAGAVTRPVSALGVIMLLTYFFL